MAFAEHSASSEMAPKRNQPGDPTTTVLGLSKMTSSLLDDLARRGFVSADDVRAPLTGEISAHPRADEVVVFRDLFTAGLRMPLEGSGYFSFVQSVFASDDTYFSRSPKSVYVAGKDLPPSSER